MEISFRNATIDDLQRIVSIYNATIPTRLATADLLPVSVEDKIEWFRQHDETTRPLWVVHNEDSQIVGWASFNSFYGRPAYQATAEISIYVDEPFREQGIGSKIIQHCLDSCSGLGIKTLLGFVFSHNTPSLDLFHRFGFEDWGVFPNVAELDGEERTLIIVGKRVVS